LKLIDTAVAHLMLMRVGTDGSSSQIDVKDWESKQIEQSIFEGSSTAVQTGVIPTLPWAQMITNADQGTVLTWEADTPAYCASGTYGFSACNTQVAAASTYGFATTVDTNVAYSGSTLTPIYPALQAQDGSFYGTDNNGNMISFSQSGNVIWSIPNDYPQIATADGGVIGASVKAGVIAKEDSCRFGFHNLRHSLASFLVRSKTDPKTVQALLRHSDVKTTLQLYAHSVSADRMTAQGEVLQAILGGATPANSGLNAD
jgi:hypothetical protein